MKIEVLKNEYRNFRLVVCTFTPKAVNQDSFNVAYVNEEEALVSGVYDGIGSHANSEMTSNLVSRAITKELVGRIRAKAEKLDQYDMYFPAYAAHKSLGELGLVAGTTASYLAVLKDLRFMAGNCGDSRQYRYQPGIRKLTMLTLDDKPYIRNKGDNPILPETESPTEIMDHFLTFRTVEELQELLKLQQELANIKISRSERRDDPSVIARLPNHILIALSQGSQIDRSIDGHNWPFISVTEGKFERGDMFLQCSDGLSDVLTTTDIEDTLGYKIDAKGLERLEILATAFTQTILSRKQRDLIIPCNVSDDVVFVLGEVL